jgi:hypothetical protein
MDDRVGCHCSGVIREISKKLEKIKNYKKIKIDFFSKNEFLKKKTKIT